MVIKEIKGKAPVLNNTYVAENVVIIGDVTCEEDVNMWYGAVVRGDVSSIKIKKGSNVQDNVVVHCDWKHPVTIGEYCSLGHGSIVHGCTLEDHVLVGMGATLLNGCHIGKNCVIGANALVAENKVIPDNSLVVGVPGKVIRQLSEDEIAFIEKNALVYAQHSKEELVLFENK